MSREESIAHSSIPRSAVELEGRNSYTEARDIVVFKDLRHAEYIIEPIVVCNPRIWSRTKQVFLDAISLVVERRRMSNRS